MSGNGKFHTRNQWTEEFESHLAASLAVCLLRGILNYGLYLSFPLYVAMMVVGSIHREECPVNKRIPWYLILGKKMLDLQFRCYTKQWIFTSFFKGWLSVQSVGNFTRHTWNSLKVCTELYPSSDRSIQIPSFCHFCNNKRH